MSATVKDQLSDALASFEARDPSGADAVVERDDVVDNLYSHAEERIFNALSAVPPSVSEARRMRAALRVLSNLERIGDAACHIAKHAIMMCAEGPTPVEFPLEDLTRLAILATEESVGSFLKQDLDLAKSSCEREREVDELYVKKLQLIMSMLDGEENARYLLHVLAVMKYLEKTADFALNIGEAVFFSVTGTRLKYPQFKQLEMLLAEADPNGGNGVVYRHFWDGISGAIVLEIDSADGNRYLFKEGMRKKIEQEIDRVIEWESLAPTHTPRLIGRAQDKDRRAVLREFAEGALLQDILLSPDDDDEGKFAAIRPLTEALIDIWSSTLVARPPRLDYAQQTRVRLREVLRRHPNLERTAKEELEKFGGIFGALDLIQKRERGLAPPFSVWVHGDLNANNVVYDAATRQVVFIDVHRSRYGDYVGDIGVLLTSTFRQFPKKKVARAVALVHERLLEAVSDFGFKNEDRFFEERLRLARARALITSARLTDDAERADALFIEGLKYLKKVLRPVKV
jgi:phosphate transport system regulatory protein PhoU